MENRTISKDKGAIVFCKDAGIEILRSGSHMNINKFMVVILNIIYSRMQMGYILEECAQISDEKAEQLTQSFTENVDKALKMVKEELS